jgi:hypothetical protein
MLAPTSDRRASNRLIASLKDADDRERYEILELA